ncbi:MAG: hypothetical protein JWR37_3100 [Mycobacterium sp.]|jgi:hypothetical protein|nr:hypothetical protein [Mycobacterium sp.]
MADDELDELYEVEPEEFTALRGRLAAAAKHRGDAAAAKRISATRKPTTAARVVNLLARKNKDARQALTDLGERLRAAHAATDGDRIRELSTEQRQLVDELARAAFDAAELTDPSTALRDDVVGTLQAAIADPDVTPRLGRLTNAERWYGFGGFGDTATVFTPTRSSKSNAEPEPRGQRPVEDKPHDDALEAARQQRERARAAVAAAERANSEAEQELAERQDELAAARQRHEEASKGLSEAERTLNAAQEAHDNADQASRDAAEVVREAKAQLKQAAN